MNTSTSKPHPLNNDLLIIYVVGGITSYEFKLVREVIREYQPEKNVLFYISLIILITLNNKNCFFYIIDHYWELSFLQSY